MSFTNASTNSNLPVTYRHFDFVTITAGSNPSLTLKVVAYRYNRLRKVVTVIKCKLLTKWPRRKINYLFNIEIRP